MAENKLDFNAPASSTHEEGGLPTGLVVYRFSPRSLFIYLALKWQYILAFFLVALLLTWISVRSSVANSNEAWTAEAIILHQTRNAELPGFYKQMDTENVMQFIASQSVQKKVIDRMSGVARYADFTPGLLRNVVVAREKNSNYISVKASAGTAETAAALANQVANEGIAGYIEYQNNSMRTRQGDLKRQLTSINTDLNKVNGDVRVLYSSNGITPDLELIRRNTDYSTLASKRSELIIKLKSVEVTIGEINKILSEPATNDLSRSIMDSTISSSLHTKRMELETLRRKYTDKNPKIKSLTDEIEILQEGAKQDAAQRSGVDASNPVYATLKSQLATAQIEKKTIEATISFYDTNLAILEDQVYTLAGQNTMFTDLKQEEDILKSRLQKVQDSISDIDFTLNSAVPDVTLFTEAGVPTSSNIGQVKLIVLAIACFLTLCFTFGLAIWRLSKFRLVASSEFETALNIENIGEMPLLLDSTAEQKRSTLQRVLQDVRAFRGDRKKLGILSFLPPDTLDAEIQEIVDTSLVSGFKVFRLRCFPASKRPTIPSVPLESDEIAKTLISVEKVADRGSFCFQNTLSMDTAEMDLLRFDMEAISAHYDLVILEVESDDTTELLSTQIAQLCECIIITVPFDTIPKPSLLKHIKQIQDTSDTKIGGYLTNVPKPYHEG